jgi:flagellar biosynthesis/type III secretory pathway protein FliH
MQKWLPDAFDVEDAIRSVAVVDGEAFQSEAAAESLGQAEEMSGFRSEAGFADAQSLLNHLTRQERAQLFDLVEQDVASEYQAREVALKEETQAQMKALESTYQESLAAFAGQIEAAHAEQIKEISAGAARLALQLAEKIIRGSVAVDPQALARVLETTLYKITGDTGLKVTLNPEDAAWLESQPELCARLKIARISGDRRIERGGCIASAEGQEWDATLARQLESLTEIVEEAIATGSDRPANLPTEGSDDPEVG